MNISWFKGDVYKNIDKNKFENYNNDKNKHVKKVYNNDWWESRGEVYKDKNWSPFIYNQTQLLWVYSFSPDFIICEFDINL